MIPASERSIFDLVGEITGDVKYDVSSIQFADTNIHIFGRKEKGVGLLNLERSSRKIWPLLANFFDTKLREVGIVDLDAPLGGGPLGPRVIGIFYSDRVEKEHQILVQQSTGWAPQSSTSDYIDQHYGKFPEPLQAYVDDMLVHEFGHLFFGWGLTTIDSKNQNDWWFAFGMGLLYDRMVWDQLYSQPSPLFTGVIAKWKDEFAHEDRVDQKLIDPDTTRDLEFGLQRLQTFGHGKAYEFLKALRERVGAATFDKIVNEFINANQVADYDLFVSMLPPGTRSAMSAVEQEFHVR